MRTMITPRGSLLETLEMKGGGMFGLVPSKVLDAEESGLFPADIVKIGDMWSQKASSLSEGRALGMKFGGEVNRETKWRLSGFSDVIGHRCAVLEGVYEEMMDSKDFDLITKGRTVIYFDYKIGVEIDTIISTTTTTTGANYPGGKSINRSQDSVTLVE